MAFTGNFKISNIIGLDVAGGDSLAAIELAVAREGVDYTAGTNFTLQANLDAAAEAARSNGRLVSYVSDTNLQQLSDLQSVGGLNLSWDTVTAGQPTGNFKTAVRVRERRPDASYAWGPWCSGSALTVASATTTTASPTTTTAAPTTTTAAPTTAYTGGTGISASTSVYKVSSSTCFKIYSTDNSGPQMYRSISFPSTGTFNFTRWFNTAALTSAGANSQSCEIVAFGPGGAGAAITAWNFQIAYGFGVSGNSGFAIGTPDNPTVVLASTSLTANTWYKVSVDINLTNKTRQLIIYAADSTTILYQSGWVAFAGDLAGQTLWSIIGRSGVPGTYYFDGIVDGI